MRLAPTTFIAVSCFVCCLWMCHFSFGHLLSPKKSTTIFYFSNLQMYFQFFVVVDLCKKICHLSGTTNAFKKENTHKNIRFCTKCNKNRCEIVNQTGLCLCIYLYIYFCGFGFFIQFVKYIEYLRNTQKEKNRKWFRINHHFAFQSNPI